MWFLVSIFVFIWSSENGDLLLFIGYALRISLMGVPEINAS